ncbi:MAG TPA: choice-of-anchor E domain-containing protein, partial [Candidatus Eisenbacteria bacterium]
DLSTLVTVVPTVTTVDTLPVFDNNLDYGGPSGRSYFNLPGAAADSVCLSGAGDLALFAGAGTISLPGNAVDGSFQTGASSWSIGPRPYATITVTYNYRDCSVPVTPSTWSGIKRLLP